LCADASVCPHLIVYGCMQSGVRMRAGWCADACSLPAHPQRCLVQHTDLKTPQHAATHYNTLQHTATHTLSGATEVMWLQSRVIKETAKHPHATLSHKTLCTRQARWLRCLRCLRSLHTRLACTTQSVFCTFASLAPESQCLAMFCSMLWCVAES